MNTKELRLGNYVKLGKVIGIDEVVCRINGEKGVHTNKHEFIDPIPITQEWLEKLNFSKSEFRGKVYLNLDINDTIYFYWNNRDGVGISTNEEECENGCSVAEIDLIDDSIKYVHQLQNIAYFLIGKELTVK